MSNIIAHFLYFVRLNEKNVLKFGQTNKKHYLCKKYLSMEKLISKLKEIAGKTANQTTKEDKEFIRQHASQYGVELPKEKPNCKSCYVDAAVQIYKAIKDAEPRPKDRKYVLRDGVDVIWRGVRINEASVTDELAEKWIANGFPRMYFK